MRTRCHYNIVSILKIEVLDILRIPCLSHFDRSDTTAPRRDS